MTRIRDAKLEDAEQICRIYNYYIEHTVVTFEEELLQVEEMRERMALIMRSFPYIVCVDDDDKVLGYAYGNTWRTRKAYRFSTETTVYLEQGNEGKGLGTLLYKELLDRLQKAGFHLAIGGISLPNVHSVKLHEKLGFKESGVFQEAGFKFDRWIDVGFWQLLLPTSDPL